MAVFVLSMESLFLSALYQADGIITKKDEIFVSFIRSCTYYQPFFEIKQLQIA